MLWALFFIGIVDLQQPPVLKVVGMYKSMEDCFEAREQVVDKIGRPIQDYQVVCVSYDATDEAI